MKNTIVALIVATSSLFILGYSIHMLIGGLVSPETERLTIISACVVGVVVLAFMGLDILKQRRRR